MKIELRALDAQRGEAIVWHSGRWYRLRRERRWYPEDLGDRQPGWVAEPRFIPTRKPCSSFAGLVAGLEEVLQPGAESAIVMRSRLRSFAEPEAEGEEAWRAELPHLIHLYQGALDQLFARRGCTPEESRPLVLETFRRLFLLGPMDGQEAEEKLPFLAADVHREVHGGPPPPPLPRLGAAGPNRRAQAALQQLEPLTLQCLILWADPRRTEAQVAAILQLPEDDVRRRLDRASAKLEKTRREVRGPEWRRAFAVTFRRKLD